jgi:hypothetical protein
MLPAGMNKVPVRSKAAMGVKGMVLNTPEKR